VDGFELRVTPMAVYSLVSTGCFQLVGTKLCAARFVHLVRVRRLHHVDERELVEQVRLVKGDLAESG